VVSSYIVTVRLSSIIHVFHCTGAVISLLPMPPKFNFLVQILVSSDKSFLMSILLLLTCNSSKTNFSVKIQNMPRFSLHKIVVVSKESKL